MDVAEQGVDEPVPVVGAFPAEFAGEAEGALSAGAAAEGVPVVGGTKTNANAINALATVTSITAVSLLGIRRRWAGEMLLQSKVL